MKPLRRVVTGLDAQGRSCVCIDGPAEMQIWSTADNVADNSGNADTGAARSGFPTSGTRFVFSDFPPGMDWPMHATDTIDYLVVISGECIIVTETGETRLKAGDVLVDRGVLHAWRNEGPEPCRVVSILCPARPVGAGATMTGELG